MYKCFFITLHDIKFSLVFIFITVYPLVPILKPRKRHLHALESSLVLLFSDVEANYRHI